MARQAALVLVIDDDDDAREALASLLELFGFTAVAARNGARALELLRGGLRPSAIVSDLVMPEMDGFRFREAQLHDPAIADIPFIACSATTDTPAADDLRADAIVCKPADPRELVLLLQRHCRSRD